MKDRNMLRTQILRTAALVGLLALTACAGDHDGNTATATPTASPAPVAKVVNTNDAKVASATFSGLSDHVTVGGAHIVGTPGAYTLVFDADFSLDGAPDPIVGFGTNGTFDPATKIGSLAKKKGAQSYSLPANFTPTDISEVYVWCERFDVPLGVATFTPATNINSGG